MYPIAAIKMAGRLVDVIDDEVSQNHCVIDCSSAKTVSSSNLSQHILTTIVDSRGRTPTKEYITYICNIRFYELYPPPQSGRFRSFLLRHL